MNGKSTFSQTKEKDLFETIQNEIKYFLNS